MDYGKILRRSWDVIWNHKFMWVLGFLAALGSGASSGGGGSGNNGFNFNESDFAAAPEIFDNLGAIMAAMAAATAIILGLLCILFVLAIVLWLVRLTAQAGMIDAAARLDAGEKITFGEAISAGWHKLGRMVGLNVILFGVFFLAAIVGVLVLVLSAGATAGAAAASQGDMGALLGGLGMGLLALICCLMCVFLLLGIVVTVLYPFAQRAAVLEDMGVIESIRRGWQVIKENLGEVIILILLFLLLSILIGAVTLALVLPLAALSFGPTVLRLFGSGTVEVLDVVLASGGLLCMILVGAAINAIYTAFRSTAVTLAYGEFTSKKPVTEVTE